MSMIWGRTHNQLYRYTDVTNTDTDNRYWYQYRYVQTDIGIGIGIGMNSKLLIGIDMGLIWAWYWYRNLYHTDIYLNWYIDIGMISVYTYYWYQFDLNRYCYDINSGREYPDCCISVSVWPYRSNPDGKNSYIYVNLVVKNHKESLKNMDTLNHRYYV